MEDELPAWKRRQLQNETERNKQLQEDQIRKKNTLREIEENWTRPEGDNLPNVSHDYAYGSKDKRREEKEPLENQDNFGDNMINYEPCSIQNTYNTVSAPVNLDEEHPTYSEHQEEEYHTHPKHHDQKYHTQPNHHEEEYQFHPKHHEGHHTHPKHHDQKYHAQPNHHEEEHPTQHHEEEYNIHPKHHEEDFNVHSKHHEDEYQDQSNYQEVEYNVHPHHHEEEHHTYPKHHEEEYDVHSKHHEDEYQDQSNYQEEEYQSHPKHHPYSQSEQDYQSNIGQSVNYQHQREEPLNENSVIVEIIQDQNIIAEVYSISLLIGDTMTGYELRVSQQGQVEHRKRNSTTMEEVVTIKGNVQISQVKLVRKMFLAEWENIKPSISRRGRSKPDAESIVFREGLTDKSTWMFPAGNPPVELQKIYNHITHLFGPYH